MIRKVKREELSACAGLIRQSFLTVAEEYGITEQNAPGFTAFSVTEERLARDFDNIAMYAAEEDGALCGFYALRPADGGDCELNNLAVPPACRRRGIGGALLAHAFDTARAAGFRGIRAGIVEENAPLRAWYEQHGFRHTGAEKYPFFPFTCGYLRKEL